MCVFSRFPRRLFQPEEVVTGDTVLHRSWNLNMLQLKINMQPTVNKPEKQHTIWTPIHANISVAQRLQTTFSCVSFIYSFILINLAAGCLSLSFLHGKQPTPQKKPNV